jgi:hypothetical protein
MPNNTLDPQVVALTKAIRQVESGGNFGASGASGEHGGYQYTPETWSGVAKKYGINVPLEQATSSQQNEVTYKRIKEWKDAGHNVGQIASMWNAGEGRPNAYRENWRGVNKFGVVYDTPAYAQKVARAYQQLKGQTAPAPVPTPTPVEEPKPFSLGQVAKEIVSPVTTMLARPFQAIQSGVDLLRTGRENPDLEANSQKYSDESYKLSMQARSMPVGPERDAVMRKAEEAAKMGQYYSERLSKNTSFKPFSTDTLIKPAPENWSDVKKDVGRGIQTVAFGMGPLSGGAAFGTGMSLEDGNDLLSWDTAAYTAGGLVLGKAADLVGKPLLNAAGNVVGKITPTILKDVAAGGVKAMQAFMEQNKLLPDAISKPLNRGAAALEVAADAPFKAAAAPFKQVDEKVIAARERALKELEEKYAQLRDNAARNPEATAGTRGRVARSNVLTEDNMVNEDGVIIGAKEAAKAYRNETIGEGESLVRQLITKEGIGVDIKTVERELQKVMKESFSGRELISALNAVKREVAGLRLKNPNGRIMLTDVHDAKVARQPGSKAYDNSETKAVDKQIARAHKQVVEKNSSEKVKEINAEIGKFLGDAEYIESLQGKRIGNGKLGRTVSQMAGAVAGAAAGGAIGGLPGVAVGSYVGGSVSRKLSGRSLRGALGKPTKTAVTKSPVFEAGRERLNRKQLALPPKRSDAPIPMGPKISGIGPVGVKAPKGEPVRNKKTGRFERTYLSSNDDKATNLALEKIKVAKAIDTKLIKAEGAKTYIDDAADKIAKEYGDKVVVAKAPLKSRERAIEKAIKEYGGNSDKIKDLARNTIMPKDKKTQQSVLDDMDKRKDLVTRKDQHPEDYMGYEGIIYHIETPSGLISETQVVTPKMIYGKMPTEEAKKLLGDDLFNQIQKETGVKPELGHIYYEQFRKLSIKEKEGKEGQALTEKSIEYYNKLR